MDRELPDRTTTGADPPRPGETPIPSSRSPKPGDILFSAPSSVRTVGCPSGREDRPVKLIAALEALHHLGTMVSPMLQDLTSEECERSRFRHHQTPFLNYQPVPY